MVKSQQHTIKSLFTALSDVKKGTYLQIPDILNHSASYYPFKKGLLILLKINKYWNGDVEFRIDRTEDNQRIWNNKKLAFEFKSIIFISITNNQIKKFKPL